ncbi:twin-arginine translocation pathway signal [Rhodococcus sp. NPDC003318]|uniref:twin-arginine translocation pathway signal n=1 Tax=Rhodococcus sp. NPDC003318 TaxID=3364503 RepID=UPI0036C0A78C
MRRSGLLTWLLAALAVVLAGLAALLFVRADRAAEQVSDAARDEVARAAADTAVALLTYTPETVAADQYAAAQRLTGDFRERYGTLTDEILVPTARDRKVTSTASVTGTGVSRLDGDRADALVFLTQVTSTEAAPAPVSVPVGARVGLTRVGDSWLVSGFETH